MTAPHSPTPSYGEPWKDGSDQRQKHKIMSHSEDGFGYYVGEIRDAGKRARAILCTNACAGLANPEKLPELIAAIRALSDEFYGCSSLDEMSVSPVIGVLDALRALQATPAESEASDEQVR